ncbi:MAG: hypothetical protein ACFFEE_11000, partial [Candidatus Thorarchaeota archaeon]
VLLEDPPTDKPLATRYDEEVRFWWNGYNRDEAYWLSGGYETHGETKWGDGFVDLSWEIYRSATGSQVEPRHEITIKVTTKVNRFYINNGGFPIDEPAETLTTEVPLTLFEPGYEKADEAIYHYGSGSSCINTFYIDDVSHELYSERVLLNPWRPDSLADKLDVEYGFSHTDVPKADIGEIKVRIRGRTSGPDVYVQIWNYDTSRWTTFSDRLVSSWANIEADYSNSYISSSGSMRIRVSQTVIYGSPFTVFIDAISLQVIYELPTYNVGWNANTSPSGKYCQFSQFESDRGITYHLDTIGNGGGDYSYKFFAYVKHDSNIHSEADAIVVDANGQVSIKGWFRQYDTFSSYLQPGRRKAYIYVMYANNPETVVQSYMILDYYDGISWCYREATITGLEPGRSVFLAIGRPDSWSYDWKLTIEWAQIQINTL